VRSIQPPIQFVPWAVSPGVQPQEQKADHSPPPSTQVKHDGATLPLSHTSSWRGSQLIKSMGNAPIIIIIIIIIINYYYLDIRKGCNMGTERWAS
jgi:hypothetical protein